MTPRSFTDGIFLELFLNFIPFQVSLRYCWPVMYWYLAKAIFYLRIFFNIRFNSVQLIKNLPEWDQLSRENLSSNLCHSKLPPSVTIDIQFFPIFQVARLLGEGARSSIFLAFRTPVLAGKVTKDQSLIFKKTYLMSSKSQPCLAVDCLLNQDQMRSQSEIKKYRGLESQTPSW